MEHYLKSTTIGPPIGALAAEVSSVRIAMTGKISGNVNTKRSVSFAVPAYRSRRRGLTLMR